MNLSNTYARRVYPLPYMYNVQCTLPLSSPRLIMSSCGGNHSAISYVFQYIYIYIYIYMCVCLCVHLLLRPI